MRVLQVMKSFLMATIQLCNFYIKRKLILCGVCGEFYMCKNGVLTLLVCRSISVFDFLFLIFCSIYIILIVCNVILVFSSSYSLFRSIFMSLRLTCVLKQACTYVVSLTRELHFLFTSYRELSRIN